MVGTFRKGVGRGRRGNVKQDGAANEFPGEQNQKTDKLTAK